MRRLDGKGILVASLVVLLCVAAWAGEAGEARTEAVGKPAESASAGRPVLPPLEKYESVHFTIYVDFSDEAYTRRFADDMERYFSMLQREFWDFIPRRHREGHALMLVFKDQEAFDAFAQRESGIPHGKKGYLSNGRMAILRQDAYYKDITIAVHELTHVFNSRCTPHTPVWLDEGMAEFYSYFAAGEIGDNSLNDGVSMASLRIIDQALKQGRLTPLATLVQMDEDTFYGPQAPVNFAEAWALVYYLRKAVPDADARFNEFYSAIARGLDDYRAFTSSYGAAMDTIEQFWLRYLAKLYAERRVDAQSEGEVVSQEGGAKPSGQTTSGDRRGRDDAVAP